MATQFKQVFEQALALADKHADETAEFVQTVIDFARRHGIKHVKSLRVEIFQAAKPRLEAAGFFDCGPGEGADLIYAPGVPQSVRNTAYHNAYQRYVKPALKLAGVNVELRGKRKNNKDPKERAARLVRNALKELNANQVKWVLSHYSDE